MLSLLATIHIEHFVGFSFLCNACDWPIHIKKCLAGSQGYGEGITSLASGIVYSLLKLVCCRKRLRVSYLCQIGEWYYDGN